MPAVVCLIADPAAPALAESLVQATARAVRGEPRTLAAGVAAEVLCDGAPDPAVLRDLVGDAPVDVAVVPPRHRRKRLLVADMDSTIIENECIDELADMAGIKPEIALITRRAMNGELDFKAALEARVALLAGLPASRIDEVIRERLRPTPGAATLVRTMRAAGARTALVSGGFTQFTGHVRDLIGFDHDVANELEIEGGRLTGRVAAPVRDGSSKLAALRQLADELALAREQTLAVGDGANDLAMIGEAGLGVAFRAHARVVAEAPVAIRHGDLTAVLYLQGYARAEFSDASPSRIK